MIDDHNPGPSAPTTTTSDSPSTPADGRRQGPATTRPGVTRPESVLVSELIGGDLVLHGIPDGALAYLAGPDADPLRAALDTAFQDRPPNHREPVEQRSPATAGQR